MQILVLSLFKKYVENVKKLLQNHKIYSNIYIACIDEANGLVAQLVRAHA